LFDPLEFLNVARSLRSGGEAHLRTCIGRAYYAMFLRARDNLADRGLIAPTGFGEDHGLVVTTLKSRRRWAAGDKLNKLRKLRATADYSTSTPVSESDAAQALRLADDISRTLADDWASSP